MKRKQRLLKNTFSSLFLQIVTIICGLILPRMILAFYNSDVNGLVNSISRFLSLITFLEFGICSVIQSALYKPLAYKDNDEASRIVVSASRFFRKVALALLVYVIVLVATYPFLVIKEFDYLYTATLIMAMSISYFAQYYFGLVDQIFLTADQKGYIYFCSQTIVVILNTIACVVMIKIGVGIQMFKLISSLIYLLRPMFLRYYVKRNYSINRRIQYTTEPIKQKWNGLAQQISAIVLGDTDVIVLTLFSTLTNVSIYSVYNLVIAGVKQVLVSMTNGFNSLLGELWAKQEEAKLNQTFAFFEWVVHTGVVFTFGCTATLILSFVSIYTKGVTDANYITPAFAILITIAHASHCLRLPYNIMIMAGNHYKQTQWNHITAAVINIVVSIAAVKLWGLVGVAIGTLVAMLYQTIWMALYISKNLIKWPLRNFIKQCLCDIGTCVIVIPVLLVIDLSANSYYYWVLLSIRVAIIWGLAVVIVNLICYRNNFKEIVTRIRYKLGNSND